MYEFEVPESWRHVLATTGLFQQPLYKPETLFDEVCEELMLAGGIFLTSGWLLDTTHIYTSFSQKITSQILLANYWLR